MRPFASYLPSPFSSVKWDTAACTRDKGPSEATGCLLAGRPPLPRSPVLWLLRLLLGPHCSCQPHRDASLSHSAGRASLSCAPSATFLSSLDGIVTCEFIILFSVIFFFQIFINIFFYRVWVLSQVSKADLYTGATKTWPLFSSNTPFSLSLKLRPPVHLEFILA